MRKKKKEDRGAGPTFCGDLDVETGDWDLMFLAEEPADQRERERGGKLFKLEDVFIYFLHPPTPLHLWR